MTARFLTSLEVRDEDEFAGTWRLLSPLVYQSEILGRTITVPADFITDFASIPRLPFVYWAEGGKGSKAATLHDLLYTAGSAGLMQITRKQADDLLREALIACGYSALTAGLFWTAVRAGGGGHWKAPNVPQAMHVEAAMQANQAITAAMLEAP